MEDLRCPRCGRTIAIPRLELEQGPSGLSEVVIPCGGDHALKILIDREGIIRRTSAVPLVNLSKKDSFPDRVTLNEWGMYDVIEQYRALASYARLRMIMRGSRGPTPLENVQLKRLLSMRLLIRKGGVDAS